MISWTCNANDFVLVEYSSMFFFNLSGEFSAHYLQLQWSSFKQISANFRDFIWHLTDKIFYDTCSQYDSVNASQLLHQLGQQAAKILPVDPKTGRTVSLETVMGTWANQVSYPLVHCIRSANKTRIVFTQVF